MKVPDDKDALQDVTIGAMEVSGLFSTYSSGSFYAAQFYEKATSIYQKAVIHYGTKGDTAALMQWLRKGVHSNIDSLHTSEATECPAMLEKYSIFRHFLRYLLDKYKDIFTNFRARQKKSGFW